MSFSLWNNIVNLIVSLSNIILRSGWHFTFYTSIKMSFIWLSDASQNFQTNPNWSKHIIVTKPQFFCGTKFYETMFWELTIRIWTNFTRSAWCSKSLPKIAKCQKNRVIDNFPYMQNHYMFLDAIASLGPFGWWSN